MNIKINVAKKPNKEIKFSEIRVGTFFAFGGRRRLKISETEALQFDDDKITVVTAKNDFTVLYNYILLPKGTSVLITS